jgi:hypothetical protein
MNRRYSKALLVANLSILNSMTDNRIPVCPNIINPKGNCREE